MDTIIIHNTTDLPDDVCIDMVRQSLKKKITNFKGGYVVLKKDNEFYVMGEVE